MVSAIHSRRKSAAGAARAATEAPRCPQVAGHRRRPASARRRGYSVLMITPPPSASRMSRICPRSPARSASLTRAAWEPDRPGTSDVRPVQLIGTRRFTTVRPASVTWMRTARPAGTSLRAPRPITPSLTAGPVAQAARVARAGGASRRTWPEASPVRRHAPRAIIGSASSGVSSPDATRRSISSSGSAMSDLQSPRCLVHVDLPPFQCLEQREHLCRHRVSRRRRRSPTGCRIARSPDTVRKRSVRGPVPTISTVLPGACLRAGARHRTGRCPRRRACSPGCRPRNAGSGCRSSCRCDARRHRPGVQ